MKKLFVVIIALVFVLLVAGCTQQQPSQSTDASKMVQKESGRVIFTVSDRAADMGLVSGVSVTIDSVMIQSTGSNWITVSSTPRMFDLLALKNSGISALLADVNLSNGTYNQIRLLISNVIVTDSTGNHTAKLPSNDLRILGAFDVSQNSTSVVAFDFLADQSLHMTGNGVYILAPVVHLQIKENADVLIDRSSVTVRRGSLRTDAEIGMDENGTLNRQARIPADADLSIDVGGRIYRNRRNSSTTVAIDSNNVRRCVGTAGDVWCEARQKCIRSWEESCYYSVTGKSNAQDCMKTPGMRWCDDRAVCINPATEVCK
ncbi:DUF4382 domain-containing protein [Candidatus Micrarchaeota archaeon]|nr:DUF4382 domain-containing protein [Candidatus Micrarchaeota archaeon]